MSLSVVTHVEDSTGARPDAVRPDGTRDTLILRFGAGYSMAAVRDGAATRIIVTPSGSVSLDYAAALGTYNAETWLFDFGNEGGRLENTTTATAQGAESASPFLSFVSRAWDGSQADVNTWQLAAVPRSDNSGLTDFVWELQAETSAEILRITGEGDVKASRRFLRSISSVNTGAAWGLTLANQGVYLENTYAATGAPTTSQSSSPPIIMSSKAWKTIGTVSVTNRWIFAAEPRADGLGYTDFKFVLDNGGSFSTPFKITGEGNIHVTTRLFFDLASVPTVLGSVGRDANGRLLVFDDIVGSRRLATVGEGSAPTALKSGDYTAVVGEHVQFSTTVARQLTLPAIVSSDNRDISVFADGVDVVNVVSGATIKGAVVVASNTGCIYRPANGSWQRIG